MTRDEALAKRYMARCEELAGKIRYGDPSLAGWREGLLEQEMNRLEAASDRIAATRSLNMTGRGSCVKES